MENPTIKTSTENVITESELKALTKFVLNEIAPNYRRDEHPIQQIFSGIQQQLQAQQDANPVVNDINAAKRLSKTMIANIRRASKELIRSHFENSEEKKNDALNVLAYTREELLYLSVLWAQKIDNADENETAMHELNEIMNGIKTHIEQIYNTLRTLMKDDLKKYQNYINAVRHVRYINELITNIDKDFTRLMKLAEKFGVGQGEQK